MNTNFNNQFTNLSEEELKEVNGGIAPVLIGLGIAASLGAGFGGGYILARTFG